MDKVELEKQYAEGRRNFTGGNFDGEDLTDLHCEGLILNRASLVKTNLTGSKLWWTLCSYTDFTEATLNGVQFDGSELRDSNFLGASLKATSLIGCCLYNANFELADLADADLRGSLLYKTAFSNTIVKGTVLDPNFTRKRPTLEELLESGLVVVGTTVYGWRTQNSQTIAGLCYAPGNFYETPVFSYDGSSICHPGLHFGSKVAIKKLYPNEQLVHCSCFIGDIVKVGNVWRAKRLFVVESDFS